MLLRAHNAVVGSINYHGVEEASAVPALASHNKTVMQNHADIQIAFKTNYEHLEHFLSSISAVL